MKREHKATKILELTAEVKNLKQEYATLNLRLESEK